jgi:hypothetical protein
LAGAAGPDGAPDGAGAEQSVFADDEADVDRGAVGGCLGKPLKEATDERAGRGLRAGLAAADWEEVLEGLLLEEVDFEKVEVDDNREDEDEDEDKDEDEDEEKEWGICFALG